MYKRQRVRSYYIGFRTEKFEDKALTEQEEPEHKPIEFLKQKSVFDRECADCPAQYASAKETPTSKWDEVSTKLSDLSTSRLHYVKVPENHIEMCIRDSFRAIMPFTLTRKAAITRPIRITTACS